MKKEIGVLLGILSFLFFSAIAHKLFEKPSKQIAKEKCIKLMKTLEVLIPERPLPTMTVEVNGEDFTCN